MTDPGEMLRQLAALPEDERLLFFKKNVLEQLVYIDRLTRDTVIHDCAKALRPVGVRLETIRQAVADELEAHGLPSEEDAADEGKPGKPSQADVLTALADDTATLFHNDQQEPFALVEVSGHGEIWPVRSKSFRRLLVREFYNQTGKAPSSDAVSQALGVIEAKACFDGPEHKLELRVAGREGIFWYDLADPSWRAVKVTAKGWEVADRPPVIFRHFKNTGVQVEPGRTSDISAVLKFVNLSGNRDRLLFIIYLVTCLVPNIPHPIAVAHGEKGAAKSTFFRVLRQLVDPAPQELLSLPADKNELALQLAHNFMPAYDNLDSLQGWQSNVLCTAATGGGISKRELYSDEDEVILSFLRCPALNGINLVASREDLLDRALLFGLERIEEEDRRPEDEFWAAFERARPSILAGMFDALAGAMRRYPTVKLDGLPRMADFCKWGYAVAEALAEKGYVIGDEDAETTGITRDTGGAGDTGGQEGTPRIRVNGKAFLVAYAANRGDANHSAIINNPVAAAMTAFWAGLPIKEWRGPAGVLLEVLRSVAITEKIDTEARTWPKAANSLVRRLKIIKSNLADAGISLTIDRDTGRNVSMVRLTRRASKTTSGTSETQAGQASQAGDTAGDSAPCGDHISGDTGASTIPPDEKPNSGGQSGGPEIPEVDSKASGEDEVPETEVDADDIM